MYRLLQNFPVYSISKFMPDLALQGIRSNKDMLQGEMRVE